METLHECPGCGHKHIKFRYLVRDHFQSGEDFRISACYSCGLLFTSPRPSAIEAGKYYQSEEYISHSNKTRGLFASLYQFARKQNLKWKRNHVSAYSTPGSIIDIGCGTGEFLAIMKSSGYQTIGIEPDEGARNLAIQNHGLDIRTEEALTDLPDASQDVVSLWHVLEHVHELRKRISEIHRLLKDGAYAFIALPNPSSYDAEYYKEYWAAWDVPRHLYHFNASTVIELFSQNGLTYIDSFPMKFDAYYVGMLSEKYRGTSLGPVRGLFRGIISNIKAGKNKQAYSSTLYLFRK